MYLQKIDIQGFKSFAAKTVIVFPPERENGKGITAIVGPNGSGKSNIADAIRWVMGEQSMKLLRSKHSEDVIFFGSDKKSQLGFCEVSLSFDNEDKAFPIDFPEVVITRRLYRTGESEYCINKNKVRLSDVTLLLAQAQFGQRSYSVIGQGMVDHIIQMPASERKEFFIEAAGVRQYQIKKEQALHKIKATKENLHHVQAMLHELEPKLKFLSRQMKRLEQREEIEHKLFAIQKRYFHSAWQTLEEQKTEQEKKIRAITENIRTEEKEQHILEEAFYAIEQHDSAQQPGDFSHIQKKYEQALAEKNHLITEQSVIEARMRVEYEQSGDAHIPWLMKRKQELESMVQKQHAELTTLVSSQEQSEREEREYLEKLNNIDRAIEEIQKRRSEQSQFPAPVAYQDIVRDLEALYIRKEACEVHDVAHETLVVYTHELFEKIFTLIQTIKTSLKYQKETMHQRDEFNDMERLFSEKDTIRTYVQAVRTTCGIQKERIESVRTAINTYVQEHADIDRDLLYFSSQTGKKKDMLFTEERKRISVAVQACEKVLRETQNAMHTHYATEKESRAKLLNIQKDMTMRQRAMEQLQQAHAAMRMELARVETHQEELMKKICDELHVAYGTEMTALGFSQSPEAINPDEARADIEKYKRMLEQIGTIDQEIVSEHRGTQERYDFLEKHYHDLTDALENLERAIQEMDTIIRERFDLSLEGINRKFQEYFQTLFQGGTARIIVQKREKEETVIDAQEHGADGAEMGDAEDDVSGIEIHATPPGKKLKSMSMLSGGEKALTAISLLCAILSINPSPFVVLDEVDAALDESNAGRLASILQELSRKTQFIIITHNRVTTHIGQVLYGITMAEDGTSHMLSLDIENIDAIVSASKVT
ncbi:AAA family ATPase [Candidatus Uhrbacteria bacterium]|nr:AAA family ATPase [Candidatus Uhrbacteria bacterium]